MYDKSNKSSSRTNRQPTNSSKQNTPSLRRIFFVFLIIFGVVFIIGIFGFRYIVNLSWVDSIQNTSFYISTMGPVAEMKTNTQKLFASFYSIISGIIFIAIASYLIDQFVSEEDI